MFGRVGAGSSSNQNQQIQLRDSLDFLYLLGFLGPQISHERLETFANFISGKDLALTDRH